MNRTILRIRIPVLALITAAVYLWLFYSGLSRGRPNYQFLVNTTGYLILIAAFVSNFQWRFISPRIVHYAFMALATGSIIAWIIVNGGRFLPQLSAFSKGIEVILIIALWLDLACAERNTPLPASSQWPYRRDPLEHTQAEAMHRHACDWTLAAPRGTRA